MTGVAELNRRQRECARIVFGPAPDLLMRNTQRQATLHPAGFPP
jgi:hypothetical protein